MPADDRGTVSLFRANESEFADKLFIGRTWWLKAGRAVMFLAALCKKGFVWQALSELTCL